MVSGRKEKQAALLRHDFSFEISSANTLKLSFSNLACSETDDEDDRAFIASSEISPGKRETKALFLSYYGLAKKSA